MCRPPSPDSATAQNPLPSLLMLRGCPQGRQKDWLGRAEPTEGSGLTRCPYICSASVYIHTPAQWLHLSRGAEGSTGFAVTLAPGRRHSHPSHSSPAAPFCSHPVTLSDCHSKALHPQLVSGLLPLKRQSPAVAGSESLSLCVHAECGCC